MNYIIVKLSNNMSRKEIPVPADTTVRKILEDNSVDYSRAGVSVDTAPISGPQLDMTLNQLGYDGTAGHDRMYLSVVVKADNAA